MTAEAKLAPIRKGLLEFLVLKIVGARSVYVPDILRRLAGTEFATQEGTLYPLLIKLRREDLVLYEWQEAGLPYRERRPGGTLGPIQQARPTTPERTRESRIVNRERARQLLIESAQEARQVRQRAKQEAQDLRRGKTRQPKTTTSPISLWNESCWWCC